MSIKNLKSLQILRLDGNKFTNLPDSIGALKPLKKLEIKNNDLMILPESIGNLTLSRF